MADLLVHGLLALHVGLLGGHIGVLSWQCRNHVLHAVWLVAHVTHTVSGGSLGHGGHTLGLRDHILHRTGTTVSNCLRIFYMSSWVCDQKIKVGSQSPGSPVWVWADSWSTVD